MFGKYRGDHFALSKKFMIFVRHEIDKAQILELSAGEKQNRTERDRQSCTSKLLLLGTEIFRGECCKEKQACSVSHQHTSVEEPLYTQKQ